MNDVYTLVKSAVLDISSYVNFGLNIEDIEECIETVVFKTKKAIVRPIPSMLMYDVRTLYKDDSDVINLMETIISELDILVVDKTKEKVLEN